MGFEGHGGVEVARPEFREEQLEVDVTRADGEVGVALAGVVVQVSYNFV